MSVADSVSTFAGLTNENEFYSHHYLAEVFKGDIKSLLEARADLVCLNASPHKQALEDIVGYLHSLLDQCRALH